MNFWVSSRQYVLCSWLCKLGRWSKFLCSVLHLPARLRAVFLFLSPLSETRETWKWPHVWLKVWDRRGTREVQGREWLPPPGGLLPYITYTGMCCPTGSWFWSSWFRTGYPFQRHFLERGIKNCGSRLYLLLKIVADYEEAFIWCISQTNKEISF